MNLKQVRTSEIESYSRFCVSLEPDIVTLQRTI